MSFQFRLVYEHVSIQYDNTSIPQNYGLEIFANLAAWFPRYARSIFTALFTAVELLTPNNRVDTSYKVFNIPHYFPIHNEGELVVSRKDCPAAVRELQKMVLEEKIPLNYIVEVSILIWE